MVFKPTLTQEDINTICTLATQGKRYSEIQEAIGFKVSKQRVSQICKRLKISARAIRAKNEENAHANRMIAKWGVNWKDADLRKSYVYQTMREKFRQKKANATRIGKAWDIEFGDLEFPSHCPILNIELNYFNEEISDNSPSFDCVIPERGYVKGNVFIVSQRANRIKNDGTADEHYSIAEFIERNAS